VGLFGGSGLLSLYGLAAVIAGERDRAAAGGP
jgi:hypothetical protein